MKEGFKAAWAQWIRSLPERQYDKPLSTRLKSNGGSRANLEGVLAALRGDKAEMRKALRERVRSAVAALSGESPQPLDELLRATDAVEAEQLDHAGGLVSAQVAASGTEVGAAQPEEEPEVAVDDEMEDDSGNEDVEMADGDADTDDDSEIEVTVLDEGGEEDPVEQEAPGAPTTADARPRVAARLSDGDITARTLFQGRTEEEPAPTGTENRRVHWDSPVGRPQKGEAPRSSPSPLQPPRPGTSDDMRMDAQAEIDISHPTGVRPAVPARRLIQPFSLRRNNSFRRSLLLTLRLQ